MSSTEFVFNSSDGLKLSGQTWLTNRESKGLVLLVHGLGEHAGRYSHVGKMLAEAGFITSAFDLRGHGKSGGKRGHSPSFEAFMDDISLFINENKTRFSGLPIFLYGHSLGALLILNYAARRNSKLNGLIATGPALRNELENQKVKVAFMNLMSNIAPTLTLNPGLNVNHLSEDKSVVEAYVNDPLVHHRASLSMAKSSLQAIDWLFDHAENIREPLLIMQGSMDKICFPSSTLEFSHKVAGEVTLKFWDGFFHEIHNDPGWEDVIQYMIDWLNDYIH
jgi:alpha-beta hydrolase superfamily lysophospholipase